MSRFSDNIRRMVDRRTHPSYNGPASDKPSLKTTDGEPPRLPVPESNNKCSLCKENELVVPPGPNRDAAPQCIKCDRKPRGTW